MIINGILTEVKNHCDEMQNQDDGDILEQKIHTWNLFFSLTELSKGDLDAEI